MNARERQFVLDQFAASEARLPGLVDGLTAEQWHFRESPERWSIAEILEHVVNVEDRVLGRIQRHLESGKPTQERGADPERDAELAVLVRQRTRRVQAPQPVRPTGKWPDNELIERFKGVRSRSRQFAAETAGNLRGYSMQHVVFGDLDCYQWLVILAGHSDRHAQQIEEIMANPAYPRKTNQGKTDQVRA